PCRPDVTDSVKEALVSQKGYRMCKFMKQVSVVGCLLTALLARTIHADQVTKDFSILGTTQRSSHFRTLYVPAGSTINYVRFQYVRDPATTGFNADIPVAFELFQPSAA